MQREPVVSGQFYPADAGQLRQMVNDYLAAQVNLTPNKALGILVPHAGYVYSGAIAGATFAAVEIPDRVILIGPNHHGRGDAAAVYPHGSWVTPLGAVAIDAELAQLIIAANPNFTPDFQAHRYEHSLEVMLPFLQLRNSEVNIVPISLTPQPFSVLEQMAQCLTAVIEDYSEPVLIVASSDMTHYESAQQARQKDLFVLEALLKLDAAQLYQRVKTNRISMCGMCATVLMLLTVNGCGAKTAALIHYGNSGDVSGDMDQVVGYAGVVVR